MPKQYEPHMSVAFEPDLGEHPRVRTFKVVTSFPLVSRLNSGCCWRNGDEVLSRVKATMFDEGCVSRSSDEDIPCGPPESKASWKFAEYEKRNGFVPQPTSSRLIVCA